MRTIQHPDVEIREIDQSQVAPSIAGTTSLIAGFSDRGEENEPFEFTSRNAFLNYFGQPTNEAEYYFYHAANEILQQSGGLIAARLPYNNDSKGKFVTQTFKLSSTVIDIDDTSLSGSELESEGLSGFVKIEKQNDECELKSLSEIDKLRTGTYVTSGCAVLGDDEFIIVNKLRDTLKKTSNGKEVGGIFTAIVTPWNAIANQSMAGTANTSSPYDGWNCISDITDLSGNEIKNITFVTPISGDFRKNSLAKQLGAQFPALVYDTNNKIDSYYLHQIMVVVCKTYEDTNNDNKIGVELIESFVGSLNKAAIDSATGESIFIDYIINNNSDYIEMYSKIKDNTLAKHQESYMFSEEDSNLMSFTSEQSEKNIKYTDITSGLTNIFGKTANIDEMQIDIVADGGISTISNYINKKPSQEGIYDPTIYNSSTDDITGSTSVDSWKTIATNYIEFCKDVRRDCIAIIDAPRNLVLQGNEKIERPTAPDQLIDTWVLPKLKYLGGLNSSYGAGYIMWDKVVNEFTGKPIWVPPSCNVAGIYTYNDRVANFWDAPAGLNRGILYGVTDIAFNPKPGQMDAMYTKSWNYARNYPLDGIVLEGQKTLQVKPSAFDRVNVRRLFLRLERLAYQVLKYYRYEPNNYFTRTQIIDVLTPIFESVKMKGGLYDYRIICDESNNTPEVIDRNELKIAFMLKPTKTAEYILADFYALSTGASFSEIIL